MSTFKSLEMLEVMIYSLHRIVLEYILSLLKHKK